jgi:prepilin-type N-terminal cleavage/methylation domain-containing protein
MLGKTYASPQRNEGFSLIELIIVVEILAIFAAAAVPNLMTYCDQAYLAASLSDGIRGALAAAAASDRTNSYPLTEQVARLSDLN